MSYCIDSNVLIQAHRKTYGFEVAPGFWSALAGAAEGGQLFVLHEVFREIVGNQDELSKWLKNRKSAFLRDERGDSSTVAELARIDSLLRTRQPRFTPTALNEYYGCADSWIVAYSSAHGHTIVTEEVAEPLRKKRVKIPDVCGLNGVDVPYITTHEFMHVLGMKLVLE